MKFIQMNVNPRKKKTGDCSVRAIVSGTGKSWLEVYRSLCAIGEKEMQMPNAKGTIELYLLANGWTRNKMPRHSDRTKYTVRELADEKKGTLIIQVASHFTAVVDGDLVDTWDCSGKTVYNFYTK